MSYYPRKLKPAAQAKVDALATEYRAFVEGRTLVEAEVRAEIRRRLDDKEAIIARQVFEVVSDPDVTNRAVMIAIGKQNPARWKEYLEKWSHLYDEKLIADDRLIERELTMDEFHAMRVDGYVFIKPTGLRAFKMLTLKYPHLEKARANDPGNDVILYWPDKPLYDGHWERMTDNNPAWANNPGAPIGEHREAIVKAVLGWVGESGGETP